MAIIIPCVMHIKRGCTLYTGAHYTQQNRVNVGQGRDVDSITSQSKKTLERGRLSYCCVGCRAVGGSEDGLEEGLEVEGLWDSPDVRREGGGPC